MRSLDVDRLRLARMEVCRGALTSRLLSRLGSTRLGPLEPAPRSDEQPKRLGPTRCIRCIGTTSAAHELPIRPRSTIFAIALRHEGYLKEAAAPRYSGRRWPLRVLVSGAGASASRGQGCSGISQRAGRPSVPGRCSRARSEARRRRGRVRTLSGCPAAPMPRSWLAALIRVSSAAVCGSRLRSLEHLRVGELGERAAADLDGTQCRRRVAREPDRSALKHAAWTSPSADRCSFPSRSPPGNAPVMSDDEASPDAPTSTRRRSPRTRPPSPSVTGTAVAQVRSSTGSSGSHG